jgi:hypothetical protein
MHHIFLATFLLFSQSASSDQLAIGLATTHFINSNSVATNYKGCLHESCETIFNPIFAYRFLDLNKQDNLYSAVTVFAGLNSVAEAMTGTMYSYGLAKNSWKAGIVQGFYLQNNAKYRQANIEPFYLFEVKNIGIVPVIGVELQKNITNQFFITGLITPILSNIGFGINF